MSTFRKYNPDIGDELRHKLWELKEATGVPMSQHLKTALTEYLARQTETTLSQEASYAV